tara:strand:+ start:16 stop:330 length:315 start_codon:yes stop_codon:yes gene_type:complete
MGNDNDYTITINNLSEDIGGWANSNTITLDNVSNCITDTGSEFTYNVPEYDLDLTQKSIEITRIEKMNEHYPALKKAWENFYAIYKMVDQDYIGNHEKDEEIPF